MAEQKRVIWFDRLRMSDIEQVGGKNASLGEMIAQLGAEGVQVPGGFATTAAAFREFLAETKLSERIAGALAGLDVNDVAKLARVGAEIRGWIVAAPLPAAPSAQAPVIRLISSAHSRTRVRPAVGPSTGSGGNPALGLLDERIGITRIDIPDSRR